MKNLLLLVTMCLFMQGCFTVKSRIDLSKKPVAAKNSNIARQLKAVNPRINLEGSMLFNEFKYKSKTNGKALLIENKTPSRALYSLVNSTINTKIKGDSLYMEPKGSYNGITFLEPLNVKYGSLKGKLIKVYVDTLDKKGRPANDLVFQIRVNIFQLFGRNASKYNADTNWSNANIVNIQNQLEFELSNFTQLIDNSLGKAGDLDQSCSKDIHWKGQTSIVNVSKDKIRLKSRVRFESWTCGKAFGKRWKTRNFRSTNWVTYDISINNDSKGSLQFNVAVGDVKHFPGELEQYLRKNLDNNFGAQRSFGLNGFNTKLKGYEFKLTRANAVQITATVEAIPK